ADCCDQARPGIKSKNSKTVRHLIRIVITDSTEYLLLFCSHPFHHRVGYRRLYRLGTAWSSTSRSTARGDISASRRSEWPKPGRSRATRGGCSTSRDHVGSNAYRLSGHGLSRRASPSCAPFLSLSTKRMVTPSMVRKRG